MTLEELPPVLVLHLKRFVYEKTGGCQKLIKNIEYPVDLEISKGKDFGTEFSAFFGRNNIKFCSVICFFLFCSQLCAQEGYCHLETVVIWMNVLYAFFFSLKRIYYI